MEAIRIKKPAVLFFDLFFTLIAPDYPEKDAEYEVLGLSLEEWESAAEAPELYMRRASGRIQSGEDIFREIAESLPFPVDDGIRRILLERRLLRMRRALTAVRPEILETLRLLRERGYRLCLISNADCVDTAYWPESPLAPLFEDAVFSHRTGLLKPDPAIYSLAAERMGALPADCLFIGDGGSDELKGAREAGMQTLLTEYLDRKEPEKRAALLRYADETIGDFSALLRMLP